MKHTNLLLIVGRWASSSPTWGDFISFIYFYRRTAQGGRKESLFITFLHTLVWASIYRLFVFFLSFFSSKVFSKCTFVLIFFRLIFFGNLLKFVTFVKLWRQFSLFEAWQSCVKCHEVFLFKKVYFLVLPFTFTYFSYMF